VSIVLSVLGVAVALFLLGVAVVVAACFIEQWLEERRRRQLLADRALSEARIQLRTAQATRQLLDVARDSMASSWPVTIRGEQAWEEDDHG
jgi:hypothetical protein